MPKKQPANREPEGRLYTFKATARYVYNGQVRTATHAGGWSRAINVYATMGGMKGQISAWKNRILSQDPNSVFDVVYFYVDRADWKLHDQSYTTNLIEETEDIAEVLGVTTPPG